MNSVELLDNKTILKQEAKDITSKARQEIRMLSDEERSKIDNIKEKINQINEELRNLEDVQLPEEINNLKNQKQMEKKNFSLVAAIRNAASNKQQDELTQAVIDAGQENMRMSQTKYQGQIQLPSAEFRTITKATEGTDVVATDIYDIAQAIHDHSVLSELGCRVISGLVGDVQFPVISTANATWEAETATTTATTPTFTSVKLAPKRLSCVVPISKMLLSQDSAGIERAVRNEITKAIMGKLESTVFGAGAGSATQPAGIFNGTISTTIATFADITALEAVTDGTDGYGEKKYLMAPNVKAALRSMIKGTNGTGMVMENGEVDGTKASVSAFVPNNDIAFGDFSNIVVGIWDGLDIVVDNYTLAADGCIRLVVNFYCDAQVTRSGAISVAHI